MTSEVDGVAAAHEQACAQGENWYADPATGCRVFTRVALEARGQCCGCGCRHCPFHHERVVDKARLIQQPAFLHRRTAPLSDRCTLLFWSGGKDSFLALRSVLRSAVLDDQHGLETALDSIVLVTTFDAVTRRVAHQEVSVSDIEKQAKGWNLNLVGVPLSAGQPYLDRLASGLDVIRDCGGAPHSLVFGDLHLAHIRQWREQHLAALGLPLKFPLWHATTEHLLRELEASQVSCVISACPAARDLSPGKVPGTEPGSRFDRATAERARRAGWDAFGENGEFHTLVETWCSPLSRALGLDAVGPATRDMSPETRRGADSQRTTE